MQCTPNAREVSGPLRGDGTRETAHINLRSVFSAPRGWCMLSADYRQVELRLMAHLAGESDLQRVFSAGLLDPFTRLAAEMHDKAEAAVTPEERTAVKQLFYGILYGMGAKALATKLGCGINAAAALRQQMLTRYPRARPPPVVLCMLLHRTRCFRVHMSSGILDLSFSLSMG